MRNLCGAFLKLYPTQKGEKSLSLSNGKEMVDPKGNSLSQEAFTFLSQALSVTSMHNFMH